MSVSAVLICGWVLESSDFYKWCELKGMEVNELLSNPEEFRDHVPASIVIRPIYPFPQADGKYTRWGIHLSMCNGTFSSISNLPPYLLNEAKEFYYHITSRNDEPRCYACLSYT